MWQDWCPLCGSRFEADSPEGLTQKIVDHIDSGYCEQLLFLWRKPWQMTTLKQRRLYESA